MFSQTLKGLKKIGEGFVDTGKAMTGGVIDATLGTSIKGLSFVYEKMKDKSEEVKPEEIVSTDAIDDKSSINPFDVLAEDGLYVMYHKDIDKYSLIVERQQTPVLDQSKIIDLLMLSCDNINMERAESILIFVKIKGMIQYGVMPPHLMSK